MFMGDKVVSKTLDIFDYNLIVSCTVLIYGCMQGTWTFIRTIKLSQRSQLLLELFAYRTTHYHKTSFLNSTVHLWNNLPAMALSITPDASDFKSRIRKHYYSPTPFLPTCDPSWPPTCSHVYRTSAE